MASDSPGCASAIFGRGTGPTPGPGSMPPTGANHGSRLGIGTRQTRQMKGRNRRAAGMAHTGWSSGFAVGHFCLGRQGWRCQREVLGSGLL